MATLELETHVAGDADDGDIVGHRWIIDATHSVWVGEISRRSFDMLTPEEMQTYGDDMGCFYALYGKDNGVILGRAPDLYLGKDVAEFLALGFAANPERMAVMLSEKVPA